MVEYSFSTIITWIRDDEWMMSMLRASRALELSDWWIAGGFIRNKVWDILHGYSCRTAINDIDLIYFNSFQIDKYIDRQYEEQLSRVCNGIQWSVKNQARMHVRNGHRQYTSSLDAVSNWTETATCIGASIDAQDLLTIIAPYGINDLVNLIVRPTPNIGSQLNVYRDRIIKKQWGKKWPKLTIL